MLESASTGYITFFFKINMLCLNSTLPGMQTLGISFENTKKNAILFTHEEEKGKRKI